MSNASYSRTEKAEIKLAVKQRILDMIKPIVREELGKGKLYQEAFSIAYDRVFPIAWESVTETAHN